MQKYPIGSCCSRPRFNFVGGVDDDWPRAMRNGFHRVAFCGLFERARKIGRMVVDLAAVVTRAKHEN